MRCLTFVSIYNERTSFYSFVLTLCGRKERKKRNEKSYGKYVVGGQNFVHQQHIYLEGTAKTVKVYLGLDSSQ
jgi:hypothetical protein